MGIERWEVELGPFMVLSYRGLVTPCVFNRGVSVMGKPVGGRIFKLVTGAPRSMV